MRATTLAPLSRDACDLRHVPDLDARDCGHSRQHLSSCILLLVKQKGAVIMTSSRTAILVGLLAAGTLVAPAFANPYEAGHSEQVRRTVHLNDVDVHTGVGAHVAAWRIWTAASYVCGGDSRPILTLSDTDFNECRNGAVDRALASLNAPMVSAALGRSSPTDIATR
jgi:UrcA family protein